MARPIVVFWRFGAIIWIMTLLVIVIICNMTQVSLVLLLLFSAGVNCVVFSSRYSVFDLFISLFPLPPYLLFFPSLFGGLRTFETLKICCFWFLRPKLRFFELRILQKTLYFGIIGQAATPKIVMIRLTGVGLGLQGRLGLGFDCSIYQLLKIV